MRGLCGSYSRDMVDDKKEKEWPLRLYYNIEMDDVGLLQVQAAYKKALADIHPALRTTASDGTNMQQDEVCVSYNTSLSNNLQ